MQWIWLNQLRNASKFLNSIKTDRIYIEVAQNRSKNSKLINFFDMNWFFRSFNQIVQWYNQLFWSFNWLLSIFNSKKDQKWLTLIENRLNMIKITIVTRNRRCTWICIVIVIQIGWNPNLNCRQFNLEPLIA